MNYTEIESPYLKAKIAETTFSKRKEIDDLLQLQRFVIDAPKQWASNLYFHLLKNKYKEDFLELLKEHSVTEYEKFVTEELERMKEPKDQKEIEEQQIEAIKQDWLNGGGKP